MDIEEPLFQPFPSDIVFQNFNPFETYQVPLQLRNNDKVKKIPKKIRESYIYAWSNLFLNRHVM